MSFRNLSIFALFVCVVVAFGCSAKKVTRAELEALKPGDIVVFRYHTDKDAYRYSEKITRIEGDLIYYYPSKYEIPTGGKKDYKIVTEFVETNELSRTKEEYYKFEHEQGPEKRAIMWIE